MLFRRRTSEPPPAPSPAPPPPAPIIDPSSAPAGPFRFSVTGAFHVTGMPELLTGTVASGVARVGMRVRMHRPTEPAPRPAPIDVIGIMAHRAGRFEWTPGGLSEELREVGPGLLVGLKIRAAEPKTVKKGDWLVD